MLLLGQRRACNGTGCGQTGWEHAYTSKLAKLLGLCEQEHGQLVQGAIISLYSAVIRPYLKYRAQFWDLLHKKELSKLKQVQLDGALALLGDTEGM